LLASAPLILQIAEKKIEFSQQQNPLHNKNGLNRKIFPSAFLVKRQNAVSVIAEDADVVEKK
jgi:hypothetical protein